ncbi:MAG: response regulator [Hyphomonadaceae bacterium]|nr:response regulator [Hyphomonadaceae bacterium]
MWTAERIEKLVPYLRRYARAATGDTVKGDACVERVLQQIIDLSMDTSFEETEFDRERLFAMLDQQLDQLSGSTAARARRALLLIAVEALPHAAVRRILGVSDEELEKMLIIAEADFTASTATRMLIIEDEVLISAQLKRLAEGLGHKVIGVAITADAAVAISKEQTPDIVLCDIHLADGSQGTDAIAAMQLPDSVPVVFVTAYPEKYLSTTNEGPSYLITKPFDPEYLKAVIGHALINVQSA